MTELVRCPSCRGTKKVPKLGGMIGTCNTCSGKGSILAVDKPAKVEIIVEDVCANELIHAVAQAVPAHGVLNAIGQRLNEAVKDKFVVEVLEPVALPEEPAIKVDGKKALYRHKKK